MSMSIFDRVHKEVLDATSRDGGLAGLEKYMEHKRFYDNLPKFGKDVWSVENPWLRKKLEVIDAVEQIENLSGASFAVRQGVRVLSEDSVDYIIESLHSGLKILDEKNYRIIPNPLPAG